MPLIIFRILYSYQLEHDKIDNIFSDIEKRFYHLHFTFKDTSSDWN